MKVQLGAHRFLAFLYIADSLLSCRSALAQALNVPDKAVAVYTAEGVDPISGELSLDIPEFSLGDASDPLQIDFRRLYRSSWTPETMAAPPFGAGFTHNYVIGVRFTSAEFGQDVTFILGRKQLNFHLAISNSGEWSYSSAVPTGATAQRLSTPSGYETVLTTSDGTRFYFPEYTNTLSEYANGQANLVSMARKVVAPNGEQLTFSYEASATNNGVPTYYRLKGVRNTRGYGFTIQYEDQSTGGTFSKAKQTISRIFPLSSICPSFPSCETPSSRKLEYTYNVSALGTYTLRSSKDLTGYATTYDFTSYPYLTEVPLTAVYLPSEPSLPYLSITYADAGYGLGRKVVSTIVEAGRATSFVYPSSCSTSAITTVKKGTAIYARYGYVLGLSGEGGTCVPWGGSPTSIEDSVGTKQTMEYDWGSTSYYRLKARMEDEGNSEEFGYDARGNVLVTTYIAKNRVSKLTDKSEYPTCNGANFRACNKPSLKIDRRNIRTALTWSDVHGGSLSQTAGLDAEGKCLIAGGICPQISYTYQAFTGPDGEVFYLPSSRTEKINASTTALIQYTYDATSHFRLKSEEQIEGGITIRTCNQYDDIGNRVGVVSPNGAQIACP